MTAIAPLLLNLSLALAAGGGEPPQVVLAVDSAATSEAVTGTSLRTIAGFALLPAGRFRGDRFAVRQQRGAAIAAEVRVSGRHADGSARAVTILAQVGSELVRAGGHLVISESPRAPVAPAGVLTIRSDGDVVQVDTGAFTIALARSGPHLVPSLVVGGRELRRGAGAARFVVRGGIGDADSARNGERSIAIESRGSLEARCTIVGAIAGDDDEPVAAYRWTLRFRRGSASIESRVTITPAFDVGLCDEVALEIPIVAFDGDAPPRVRVIAGGPEVDAPSGRRVGAAAQDGQRLEAFVDAERSPLDPAARSGVRVRAGSVAFGVTTSRLRALAPRMVEWTRDGSLRVRLLGAPEFLEENVSLTADLAIAARRVDGPDGAGTLAELDRGLAAEPLPSLRPLDPIGAVRGALPADAALAGKNLERIEESVVLALAAVDRALGAMTGARDFGDYPLDGGFANLEYDPARAFLLTSIGRGDASSFLGARDMLLHWTRNDRSDGIDGDQGFVPPGFPWQHGREHRSMRHEAGHVWSGGITTAALVTDDEDLRVAALELRSALVQVAAESGEWRDERCFGWMLLALEDSLLLEPDASVLAAVARLKRDLLARQDPAGFFRIDLPGPGVDAQFAPCPWVTAGITFEALYRVSLHDRDPALRTGLARCASFLVDLSRDANGVWAKRVRFGPEIEGGRECEGEADAIDRLAIASGLGRAALLDASPSVGAVFEETLASAVQSFRRARLSPNAAARALVALRSLADTRSRLAERR